MRCNKRGFTVRQRFAVLYSQARSYLSAFPISRLIKPDFSLLLQYTKPKILQTSISFIAT